MKKGKTLREIFSFPGFTNIRQLEGKFGDPKARIIILKRKKKQQPVQDVALSTKIITIKKFVVCVIVISKAIVFIFVTKDGGCIVKNVMVSAWKN